MLVLGLWRYSWNPGHSQVWVNIASSTQGHPLSSFHPHYHHSLFSAITTTTTLTTTTTATITMTTTTICLGTSGIALPHPSLWDFRLLCHRCRLLCSSPHLHRLADQLIIKWKTTYVDPWGLSCKKTHKTAQNHNEDDPWFGTKSKIFQYFFFRGFLRRCI